jgi:lysophospholipase L1-like esterase
VARLALAAAVCTVLGCGERAQTPGLMRAELTSAPEEVHLVGRFDTSDPKGPRLAWSASAVVARFTGASISARLHDEGNNYFLVVVDGKPSGLVGSYRGRELYPLASGLGPGEHEVMLYKRTEAKLGEVQFGGFVPDAPGKLVPVSPRRGRRIELIGDSITAGYGNEGTSPTCPFRPSSENEYLAYGAITARNLGAEHVTIAWSGKTILGMAELYDRTLPARTDSPWDPHTWVPDVVVMNLGTNDFARGDPGASTFTRNYESMIQRVRAAHPHALIVCALGPMLSDRYPEGAACLTHARKYITQVVDAVRARGDTRVTFLEFPVQDPTTAGCDFHPNLTTHRQMADELTAVLKTQMGW